MSAQRIKRGFHRIGLVIAVPCAVIGAIAFAIGIYNLAQGVRVSDNLAIGVMWIAFGIVSYLVTWAIGWIIAGFKDD